MQTVDAETPKTQGASPRRRLSIVKNSLFAALVTILFFALLEGVLTLMGVRPILYDQDPFVGFSRRVPLFVEQRGDDGRTWMVTAENRLTLFNSQRFPKVKAAGVRRVFCMGGSTTYGRPYDDHTSFAGWLREYLPAVDGSAQWEVINAGGISYASYRVAMLMEELAEYEPDLFIIYCGHNEFLERRTYAKMLRMPLVLRNAHVTLSQTRTYSAAMRLLLRPEAQRPAASGDILPPEVDAILDRSMGPEDYHRDDAWSRHVQEHYRVSLIRMVTIARAVGARVIFVAPACNLRDFTPFKSEHRDGLTQEDRDLFQGYLQAASDAFARQEFERSREALDLAAQIDDRYAQVHFLRGRVLLRLGRIDQARQAFIRARDEDVCPLRALTTMRQIVLDVARSEQTPVIDFVAMQNALAEDGIPGADLFLDHVHPKIDGHRRLALRLINEMQAMGMIQPGPDWNEAAKEAIAARVYGSLDSAAHANALRNLSKVLGWAGKFEEAERLALQAVQGLPYDANAHYLAGRAHRRQGRLEQAVEQWERSLDLEPTYLLSLRALASAATEAGQVELAIQRYLAALERDPSDYILHSDIAFLYLAHGDLDAAQDHFQLALIIEPDDALSYLGLGQVAEAREDFDAGREYFRRALELAPDSQRAREALDRCRDK